MLPTITTWPTNLKLPVPRIFMSILYPVATDYSTIESNILNVSGIKIMSQIVFHLFTEYSGTLLLHRRSFDTFYSNRYAFYTHILYHLQQQQ